jgi:ribonuclease III
VIPVKKSDPLPEWVAQRFGHVFADAALIESALTHRSAGADHNERLEFLGDSVLSLCVSRSLFEAQTSTDEGGLSRLRAALVSGETLAEVAAELDIGEHLRLGAGELKSGGFRRASILADALEAIFGAIFLDGGYEAASASIRRVLGSRLSHLPAADSLKDGKTRLQELLQGRGMALPLYTLSEVSGDAHAQSFTARCEVPALSLSATATGSSRRRAEQLAACKVLDLLPFAS